MSQTQSQKRKSLILRKGVNNVGGIMERLLACVGLRGKAFVGAFWAAVMSGLIAFVTRFYASKGDLPWFVEGNPETLQIETAAWTGITGMLGFLIVFRASQAYGRYWSAMADVDMMRSDFYEACSSMCACTSFSSDPVEIERVWHYKQMLVRLVSLLHASTTLDLIEPGTDDDAVQTLQILDPLAFEKETMQGYLTSMNKVAMVIQWLQRSLNQGVSEKVLTAPPPIVARALMLFEKGVGRFHNAMKIKKIVFPAQYAQVCDMLMLMHWIVTPFLVTIWVNSASLAFFFTFFAVFALWSLSGVAVSIENPFNRDDFVQEALHMQERLNEDLMLMLNPLACVVPHCANMDSDKLFQNDLPHISLSEFAHEVDLMVPGEEGADAGNSMQNSSSESSGWKSAIGVRPQIPPTHPWQISDLAHHSRPENEQSDTMLEHVEDFVIMMNEMTEKLKNKGQDRIRGSKSQADMTDPAVPEKPGGLVKAGGPTGATVSAPSTGAENKPGTSSINAPPQDEVKIQPPRGTVTPFLSLQGKESSSAPMNDSGGSPLPSPHGTPTNKKGKVEAGAKS